MRTINPAAYEGDIVSRLRNWRGLHLAHGGLLFEEAADEIDRLRNSALAGREMVQPTLTAEEREAVENMIHLIEQTHEDYGREAHALRSLLERLK